jgi:hypothetical protein
MDITQVKLRGTYELGKSATLRPYVEPQDNKIRAAVRNLQIRA